MAEEQHGTLAAYANSLKADPAERINFTWYLTLFLCAVLVITSIAVAVDLDDAGKSGSRGAAFAAIWSMLLMIALCFGGTLVLRKFRTDIMIGFLVGAVAMMCVSAAHMVPRLSVAGNQVADDVHALRRVCWFSPRPPGKQGLRWSYGVLFVLPLCRFVVLCGCALGPKLDSASWFLREWC